MNCLKDMCKYDGFFLVPILVNRYYKRGYREFFLTYDPNAEKNSANSASYLPDSYRLGWLLFLALRNHAFSRFKDLVTCSNGLVSILVSDLPVKLSLICHSVIVLERRFVLNNVV